MLICLSANLLAQIPPVNGPSCVWCEERGVSNCPAHGTKASTPKSATVYSSQSVSDMVAGAIVGNLLSNLFAPADNRQQEAEEKARQLELQRIAWEQAEKKRIQDAIDLANYNKLMRLYQPLPGAENSDLTPLPLDFNDLNGEAEQLSGNAGSQFDALKKETDFKSNIKAGTDFFGDENTVAPYIEKLTNPENDTVFADINKAVVELDKNKKTDIQRVLSLKDFEPKGNGEPIKENTTKPPCDRTELIRKYNAHLSVRDKFFTNVSQTQTLLKEWEEKNNEIMMNAAKDGIKAFAGNYLDKYIAKFEKRAEVASRLKGMLTKNKADMIKNGVDISAISAKIDKLQLFATCIELKELGSNINNWTAFVKSGMSDMIIRGKKYDETINSIADDQQMQKYFDLDTGPNQEKWLSSDLKVIRDVADLGMTYKVFSSWVCKRAPMIAWTQLAIDQTYNITDWVLSLQNVYTLREASGKEEIAAKSLQKLIDDSYNKIVACK